MNQQKLINAPIKEAVVDLKFTPNEAITLEILSNLSDSLSDFFPNKQEWIIFNFGLQANLSKEKKEHSSNTELSINGYRLFDQKRNFILKFSKTSITLSKTTSYVSWEEIEELLLIIMEKAIKHLPEVAIERLGLRYVNEFNINFQDTPANDYLQILPSFPNEISSGVDAYSITIQLSKLDNKKIVNSIIRQEVSPIGISQNMRILLDIDAFNMNTSYSIKDIDSIISELQTLRNYKNEIFFNSLTKKTLNLFN